MRISLLLFLMCMAFASPCVTPPSLTVCWSPTCRPILAGGSRASTQASAALSQDAAPLSPGCPPSQEPCGFQTSWPGGSGAGSLTRHAFRVQSGIPSPAPELRNRPQAQIQGDHRVHLTCFPFCIDLWHLLSNVQKWSMYSVFSFLVAHGGVANSPTIRPLEKF